MALDGILIKRISEQLQTIVPSKINRIQQISNDELVFTIRGDRCKYKLLISCHSTYNRINFTDKDLKAFDTPSNFLMVLRKYLEGAIIKNISQIGLDRIIRFELQARDELKDYHTYFMYVELMGKYANLVIVDEDGKIVDCLKRIPPYENSTRTLYPSAKYTLPKAHIKKNPFECFDFDVNESLVKQFHGFSPILSKEVLYRINNNHEEFKDIMNELATSDKLYLYDNTFHLIELTHLNQEAKVYELNNGLDHIYGSLEEQVRIKQQSDDIAKVIKQELKKNRNKLVKLNQTLDEANHSEINAKYGELLYAYAYCLEDHVDKVSVCDFETNEDIEIELNPKLTIKQNAKKFYQKYNKSKTAKVEVKKQIELCEDEIIYFENLEAQLLNANVLDAIEIKEELINKGYLRKKIQRRKKKNQKPNFITLNVDGTNIYIGKNNIQNDYLTFNIARRSDIWLHVKDMHGSHVIIQDSEPSEKLLRIAAMFAAYYSQAKFSSSVPVNYCEVKQIKKPKKAALGFVTLNKYQTIYIDPEEKQIEEFLKEYQIK